MAGYDGAVIIDAQINTKNASSQMVQLENRMAKAADKVDLLNKKLEKMGNTKLPTDEYREIQSQIDPSEKKLNSLVDRMEKWKELGKSTNSSTFQSMQYEVDELTKTIQYAKGEKQALIESGGAYIDPRSTEEYQNLTNQIRSASGEMQVLAKRHEELAAKQEQVSRGAKKSGGALESFGKRVGGLAKRIFVFSLITKAFRAMVSAVQEGLKNYAQYSSEYNKSMSDFSSEKFIGNCGRSDTFRPGASSYDAVYLADHGGQPDKQVRCISFWEKHVDAGEKAADRLCEVAQQHFQSGR